jgi:hypothetical protein
LIAFVPHFSLKKITHKGGETGKGEDRLTIFKERKIIGEIAFVRGNPALFDFPYIYK